ncbi:type II toxin-antitoxin system VapC family toxin [bacterium]|nr:type II toxin-antitoxin system VapC family toxin [bacterium]MCI0601504.1 type II toxin-antitoxin system VapC family toxin [bacterium]
MILVDSNILMYAAGKSHPNKSPSTSFLEKVAGGDVEAVIDAEILQEILHRYRAIGRWKDGRKVYDFSRQIFPIVIGITADTVDFARAILDQYQNLMARDALHAAVIQLHDIESFCSYDRDFDDIRGIRRAEPSDFL